MTKTDFDVRDRSAESLHYNRTEVPVPPRSALETILEQRLDEAAEKLTPPEQPAVECQVIFRDGTMAPGAIKRGPVDRTYVIGQRASRQENGRAVPVMDAKGNQMLVELVFHGSDITRLVFLREVAPHLVVPDRRIVMPG